MLYNKKSGYYLSICPTCKKDKGFVRKCRLDKDCHLCNSKKQANIGRTHNGKRDEVILNNKELRKKQIIIISEETKKKISESNKKTWIERHGPKNKNQSMIRTAFSKLLSRYTKRRHLKPRQSKSKFDLMNFTPKELFDHLESKFQPGMAWDNYGEWHIDHVKPDSLFKYNSVYDEEFKKCWNLDNLQPLWAIDNLKKGNKYVIPEI